jgi:ABC-2 type transport system permease protein
MFIMFSMSGASSSLLEHQERGTLERLLSGRMTMFQLLTAHWIFYVGLGCIQISLMFVFASLAFGLDLWNLSTLFGAGLMALVSSMASAAFVLMIATLCRSRKQLEGLSSILILIMSAIGGSMMPRFVIPSFVLKLSSVAFNAWAMDGFLKVFWYRTPDTSVVLSILPEVAVILLMAGAFLLIARLGARRWAAAN